MNVVTPHTRSPIAGRARYSMKGANDIPTSCFEIAQIHETDCPLIAQPSRRQNPSLRWKNFASVAFDRNLERQVRLLLPSMSDDHRSLA